VGIHAFNDHLATIFTAGIHATIVFALLLGSSAEINFTGAEAELVFQLAKVIRLLARHKAIVAISLIYALCFLLETFAKLGEVTVPLGGGASLV